MPDISQYDHGVPCWSDMSAQDLDAAIAFYTGLLGWEAGERGGPELGEYTNMLIRGRPAAALSAFAPEQQGPEGAPRMWNTYVKGDGADDVAKRVEKAGGQVLTAPFDVMEFGRMATFADPHGAQFSVWQPGTHAGAGVKDEPGAFTWTELNAKDVGAAAAFYQEVFGWEPRNYEGGPFPYTEFYVGDQAVAGMLEMTAEWGETPPHWMLYFATEDTDATATKAAELGGVVCVPPTDIPSVGRFAVLADPEGGTFSVIKMSEHR